MIRIKVRLTTCARTMSPGRKLAAILTLSFSVARTSWALSVLQRVR